MMHRWLNEPGIVRWWEGDDVSWEGVLKVYGPANGDPTEHWIASVDGRDVGWIQIWAVSDEQEEAASFFALGVRPSAAGIDYLVADPADRGRGVGSAMLRSFVDQVAFGRHPDYDQVVAAPYADNLASWRALEKAGFRFYGEIQDKEGPCRLMVRERSEAER